MNTSAKSSPAEIRDEIIFSSSMLDECIEELIESIPGAKARQFKEAFKSEEEFGVYLKKMMCNLVVVMSCAKTFANQKDFEEMLSILKDIDFRKYNGMIMYFAFHTIEEDINSREDEQSYLYGCLPADIIISRQKSIKEYIHSISR